MDGLQTAKQRIAQEAAAQTGWLDLAGLGLTTLPPKLLELQHLRQLNLGVREFDEDGEFSSYVFGVENHDIPADLAPLGGQINLEALFLYGGNLENLTSRKNLLGLKRLDSSGTALSDLAALECLTHIEGLDFDGCGLPATARFRGIG